MFTLSQWDISILHIPLCGETGLAKPQVPSPCWRKVVSKPHDIVAERFDRNADCSDIDILCHYFHPATPVRVSSFGSLSHFRKSSKPAEAGSAQQCLDCPIERRCAYSAKKSTCSDRSIVPSPCLIDQGVVYLEPVAQGNLGWPANTITDGPPDIESIAEALQGPYGKCVFESPNDVVDHQVRIGRSR